MGDGVQLSKEPKATCGYETKGFKTGLCQASGHNATAAHRGEAVARVFIQPKVKKTKKKTGRQNSEELEQRYRLDKQNLKTQKTRNKVRKERNYSGWGNNKKQLRHRRHTAEDEK